VHCRPLHHGSGPMEMELWRCEYRAQCSPRGCKSRADTLVRYIEEQGRFISQTEFCEEHVRLAIGGSIKVCDHRPKQV
jgi:hypothetical protein